MDRNHEGYHDPTASRAIRRMCKELHRRQNMRKTTVRKNLVSEERLMYELSEVSDVFKTLKEK